MTKQEEKFINTVKRMEARVNVRAFVVIDPSAAIDNPTYGRHGRYVISYPARGHGEQRVYAVAWLPGEKAGDMQRHSGHASGFGYDKGTAAMGGAAFFNLKTGQMDALKDQGYDHRQQLEQAGYIVIQAC